MRPQAISIKIEVACGLIYICYKSAYVDKTQVHSSVPEFFIFPPLLPIDNEEERILLKNGLHIIGKKCL